ncbi:MAG: hypothetical protein NTU44_04565 [Bacteroidetes bacterium]|nr:hypothetical protein [Bacteroidota bacterium]
MMHTIEIPDIGFSKEIPSMVSELSTEQYLDFVELFLLLTHEQISYREFRILLLGKLLKLKPPRKRLSFINTDTIHSELYRLSELMDSFSLNIEEAGKEKVQVNLALVKNLIPHIKISDRVFYGPADALSDVGFFEYIDAHHHYLEFVKTAEEDALNRLIAVLYRPEKENWYAQRWSEEYDGQRRVKYNPATVDDRSIHIAKLSYPVRFAIFLFYHGCEDFLRDGELMFGETRLRLSILYDSDRMPSEDDTGLVGVLYTLAESQVFGNAAQTADANLYDVFFRLYQLLRSLKNQQKALRDDTD